jgi:hypothetical protein
LIVKVRVTGSPGETASAPKLLVMLAGVETVRVAVAPGTLGALAEVRGPVALFLNPSVTPVTFTVIVHVVPIGALTTPFTRLMLPEPATAVTVPPHVLVTPFGVATTTPAGRGSVNARPVTATPSLLVMVNVSVELPPTLTIAGENDFVKPGAGTLATRVAVAADPVGKPVEVIVLVVLV